MLFSFCKYQKKINFQIIILVSLTKKEVEKQKMFFYLLTLNEEIIYLLSIVLAVFNVISRIYSIVFLEASSGV